MYSSRYFILVLIFCQQSVSGFLYGEEYKQIDYTHVNITVGALQRVAAFYITTILNPDNYDLKSKNSSEVIRLYFEEVPAARKQYYEAVEDIKKGLSQAERNVQQSPKYTMSNEQIEEGNRYLNEKRTTIVNLGHEVNLNLKAIRTVIGEFLFTMQDFYSNTNWIELGESVLETLGWNDTLGVPIASIDQPTCKDCPLAILDAYEHCIDNIILTGKVLTSGYIDWSRQSFGGVKPINQKWAAGQGKCSHGGEHDSSRNLPATGGINKETINPSTSPHYYLHQKAGSTATNATVAFFISNGSSLLKSLGASILGKILGLFNDQGSECVQCFQPTKSLVFVIDSTGSMGIHIQKVRSDCFEIVSASMQSSSRHPYNYILVTFNDPSSMTTYSETKNGREMQAMLRTVNASGGGDCPEYAMTGLKKAMQHAESDSCVFLFTDADAKDPELFPVVRNLTIIKHLHLINFIIGQCSGQPLPIKEKFECAKNDHMGTRRKRWTFNIFDELPGQLIPVPDKDISKPMGSVLKHNMGIKHVSTLSTTLRSGSTEFLVDSRITAFTVEIIGTHRKPTTALHTPTGPVVTFTDKNLITDIGHDTFKISVINPETGLWTVENSYGENWRVIVKLQGAIEFTQEFLEDVRGSLLPIIGSAPLADANYTLKVFVEGLHEDDFLSAVVLLDSNRNEIDRLNLTVHREDEKYVGLTPLQIPRKPFKVVIEGTVNFTKFRRELEDDIQPSSAELSFTTLDGSVFTEKVTSFVCKITNTGVNTENYQVKFSDTAGFVLSSTAITSVNVEPRSSEEVTVQLQGKTSPKTSVLYVRLYLHGTELQSLQKVLMVQTSTPPDIKVTHNTDFCNPSVLNYFNCSKQPINITLDVITKSGINVAYAKPDLTLELAEGTGNHYTVKASGVCCNPKFILYVIDNSNMMADMSFDYTDGHPFSSVIPVKDSVQEIEKEGLTTAAICGIVGGVGATLLIVVGILVGINFYLKARYDVADTYFGNLPETKEDKHRHKMTRQHLDNFKQNAPR